MKNIEKQANNFVKQWQKSLEKIKKENPNLYSFILETMEKEMKMKQKHYFTKEMKKDFKLWMVEQDYTQQDFASLCGVSVSYINLIINGDRNITAKVREIFRKGGYEICDK